MNDLISWGDLAKRYDLVLFNNAPNLGDHELMDEWYEKHTCEATDNEDIDCECEVMQWYAIEIGDWDIKMLKDEFNIEIFYKPIQIIKPFITDTQCNHGIYQIIVCINF